ncbi:MAG: saccharopine dehydrogenase NADP-binding domain-containing protein, partial [Burkholderiales bacterium]
MAERRSVVVLGGYGNFGRRICAALSRDGDVRVLIAGRDLAKARALADQLGSSAEPLELDYRAPEFLGKLKRIGPSVVVHTSGPFQGQDYAVATACIAAGCHYLDIADGRSYVAGIERLHHQALRGGVLLASGASTLPALSSAVVDRYAPQFSRLEEIRHGISSSAKPPGLATMQAVFGYVGKPFQRWEQGNWTTVYGWQDLHRRRFPEPLGWRWLAACDVPDLILFPQRYPGVRTVIFHAGLGFSSTTLATWLFSWLVRCGLVKDLPSYSPMLHGLASALERWGTAWSAMHVTLTGRGCKERSLALTWHVMAG